MLSNAYWKYLAQCRQFHTENKTFSGNGVLKHIDTLLALAEGCTSALDYGCGKGLQYTKPLNASGEPAICLEDALGFPVKKYDPAVEGFDDSSVVTPSDLVWCTDVLECLPEGDIPEIVGLLGSLARKALLVTVASYPSKKSLPNGENAHVTIKPAEWWHAQFAPIRAAYPNLKLILLVG